MLDNADVYIWINLFAVEAIPQSIGAYWRVMGGGGFISQKVL